MRCSAGRLRTTATATSEGPSVATSPSKNSPHLSGASDCLVVHMRNPVSSVGEEIKAIDEEIKANDPVAHGRAHPCSARISAARFRCAHVENPLAQGAISGWHGGPSGGTIFFPTDVQPGGAAECQRRAKTREIASTCSI